jgi:predicted DNA-binding ribbon-helix-helix protein
LVDVLSILEPKPDLAVKGRAEKASARGKVMKSSIVKRSVVISGHKTSVSLEDPFWTALREIAIEHDFTLSGLVARIDTTRQHANLSSAIRLFVLDFYRDQGRMPATG